MPDSAPQMVFLVGLIVGCVVRRLYTQHYRRGRIAHARSSPWDLLLTGLAGIGLLILPLIYLFSPWLDFADYRLPACAGWVGAALFALAQWLLWRSHADLRRNWSAKVEIQEGQSLVTGGVFRRIRHPMYAAHWLWALAQPLLLQNWIAGPALLVAFLPLYLLRAPQEEQMMLEHFGDQYRSYMERTGRLIPPIRRCKQ